MLLVLNEFSIQNKYPVVGLRSSNAQSLSSQERPYSHYVIRIYYDNHGVRVFLNFYSDLPQTAFRRLSAMLLIDRFGISCKFLIEQARGAHPVSDIYIYWSIWLY